MKTPRELVMDALIEAQKARSSHPYTLGDDGAFPPKFTIYGPQWQRARIPDELVRWSTLEEKSRMKAAVRATARIANARAVVFAADMRYLRVPAFCAHFGIAKPGTETVTLAKFQKEYTRIMEGFEFQMGNLPRDLWTEGIVAAIHGPEIEATAAIKPYRQGENDAVVFEDVRVFEGGETLEFAPGKWWENE